MRKSYKPLSVTTAGTYSFDINDTCESIVVNISLALLGSNNIKIDVNSATGFWNGDKMRFVILPSGLNYNSTGLVYITSNGGANTIYQLSQSDVNFGIVVEVEYISGAWEYYITRGQENPVDYPVNSDGILYGGSNIDKLPFYKTTRGQMESIGMNTFLTALAGTGLTLDQTTNYWKLKALTQLSVDQDTNGIKLLNDVITFDNTKFGYVYGVDYKGVRGWFNPYWRSLSETFVYVSASQFTLTITQSSVYDMIFQQGRPIRYANSTLADNAITWNVGIILDVSYGTGKYTIDILGPALPSTGTIYMQYGLMNMVKETEIFINSVAYNAATSTDLALDILNKPSMGSYNNNAYFIGAKMKNKTNDSTASPLITINNSSYVALTTQLSPNTTDTYLSALVTNIIGDGVYKIALDKNGGTGNAGYLIIKLYQVLNPYNWIS